MQTKFVSIQKDMLDAWLQEKYATGPDGKAKIRQAKKARQTWNLEGSSNVSKVMVRTLQSTSCSSSSASTAMVELQLRLMAKPIFADTRIAVSQMVGNRRRPSRSGSARTESAGGLFQKSSIIYLSKEVTECKRHGNSREQGVDSGSVLSACAAVCKYSETAVPRE